MGTWHTCQGVWCESTRARVWFTAHLWSAGWRSRSAIRGLRVERGQRLLDPGSSLFSPSNWNNELQVQSETLLKKSWVEHDIKDAQYKSNKYIPTENNIGKILVCLDYNSRLQFMILKKSKQERKQLISSQPNLINKRGIHTPACSQLVFTPHVVLGIILLETDTVHNGLGLHISANNLYNMSPRHVCGHTWSRLFLSDNFFFSRL